MKYCPKTPTEKQIKFVEDICKILDIQFPTSSREFTRKCFCNFIKDHIDLFYEEIIGNTYENDVDYIHECYPIMNDVWCEEY